MKTALLPYTAEHIVHAVSAPKALEQWVQRSAIPSAEVEANKALLYRAREDDGKRYAADVQNALVRHKKQYSALTRFARFVVCGFKRYRPEVASPAASAETQLLEQVVALQEAVVKGYELFKALPNVVYKMKDDYEKLAAGENELEARINGVEEELRTLPERQNEYAAITQRLKSYNNLSDEEQKTLAEDLQMKTGADILPSLENAEVRSLLQRRVISEQSRLSSDNPSSLLEMLNIEYASVQRQQRIIESQERQLEQGWKPALIQLSRLKEQYNMLSRFTSGARSLIGMNELRKNTVEMIAQSEEVMTDAAAYINGTRIEAEAYEESFSQPANVQIFPEADTGDAIIIDVEEKPLVMEQK